MSIKGNIFRELSNHLKAQLTFDQSVPGALPTVQWIDKYNSQTLKETPDPAIMYPAIFIGFNMFKWAPVNYKVQKGTGTIRIYSVFKNTADSYLGAPDRELALQYFEFNQAVFKALEGFSGIGFTALSRVSEREDIDHDQLIVTLTDYQTQLIDDSADETKNHLSADPELVVLSVNNFIT